MRRPVWVSGTFWTQIYECLLSAVYGQRHSSLTESRIPWVRVRIDGCIKAQLWKYPQRGLDHLLLALLSSPDISWPH
jgi:hypothetical protein